MALDIGQAWSVGPGFFEGLEAVELAGSSNMHQIHTEVYGISSGRCQFDQEKLK